MKKDWISIHIFYYGIQNYLIVNCIAPLVATLREQGLIQRYFFIKYWMEGPHVRLRLLPAEGTDEEKIKHIADRSITDFLKQHPALYALDSQKFVSLYKKMFIAEYGEEEWIKVYGKEGSMAMRPNNSFAYIEYEPEYYRYGGVEGLELAEWHFEHSSDIVIDLLRKTNVDVQSMLLGRSIQLALPFFYGIFEEDNRVLQALDNYMSHWLHMDPQQRQRLTPYAKKYQHMAPLLQQRVSKIRCYMLEEYLPDKLTETEKSWRKHVGEFRLNLERLYKEQKITISLQEQAGSTTPDDVYHYLHTSYVHMTNNRLGVSISQEVYVAYLLKRSLTDLLTSNTRETL